MGTVTVSFVNISVITKKKIPLGVRSNVNRIFSAIEANGSVSEINLSWVAEFLNLIRSCASKTISS